MTYNVKYIFSEWIILSETTLLSTFKLCVKYKYQRGESAIVCICTIVNYTSKFINDKNTVIDCLLICSENCYEIQNRKKSKGKLGERSELDYIRCMEIPNKTK